MGTAPFCQLWTITLGTISRETPAIAGIPLDFFLFGATLLGVAIFHHYTLQVALTGLTVISLYKLQYTGFHHGEGWAGLGAQVAHEWVTLTNLFCLLMGFAILSRHFEKSHVPLFIPRIVPGGWFSGFALLHIIFVMSAFLDNIAAAMIGGAMAHQLFQARVHIGYLAAIVAAANAGGSGSVLGDTTTTMMWIAGVSPFDVVHAYIAAIVALIVFGIPASLQQHAYSPMVKVRHHHARIEWTRVGIVLMILASAIAVNTTVNLNYPELADKFPFIGAAVWAAILLSVPLKRPDWEVLRETLVGTLFLLALVLSASFMPVEKLPTASWPSTFILGFVSSVFDNIPLTALAIKQGGYDWGVLAYAVGYGGSMMWFGSSAGVALSNQYHEAKSVFLWVRHGWHVYVAYVLGFFVMLAIHGWHPHAPHKPTSASPTVEQPTAH